MAALVVGSTARGLALPNSDIDVAVFLSTKPTEEWVITEFEGKRLELEYYWTEDFINLPKPPILQPRRLREAGKISHGIIIFSKWNKLEAIINNLKKAVPDPNYMAALLASAKLRTDPEQIAGQSCLPATIWSLQTAVFSLAICVLNLEDFRYQKPRWIAHDLQHSSLKTKQNFLGVMNSIFPNNAHLTNKWLDCTQDFLNRATETINQNAPPQTAYGKEKISKVKRYFIEAREMGEFKFYQAALLTSFSATLLIVQYLREKGLEHSVFHSQYEVWIDELTDVITDTWGGNKLDIGWCCKEVQSVISNVEEFYGQKLQCLY